MYQTALQVKRRIRQYLLRYSGNKKKSSKNREHYTQKCWRSSRNHKRSDRTARVWEEGQLRKISKDLLKNTPKNMERNSKTWRMGLNEINKILQAKETTDKAKKWLTDWEKATTIKWHYQRFRIYSPTTEEYIFCSSVFRAFSRINQILIRSKSIFWEIQTLKSCIFSNYNVMKLKISKNRKLQI